MPVTQLPANDECDICAKAVGSNDTAVECEKCNKWQHWDCSGLTKGEFDTVKRKNCKLTFLCITCKTLVLNADISKAENDTIKQMKSMLDEMEKRMQTFLKNEIKNEIKYEIRNTIPKEIEKHIVRPTVIKNRATKNNAPPPPIAVTCVQSEIATESEAASNPTETTITTESEVANNFPETEEDNTEEGEQETWTTVTGRKPKPKADPKTVDRKKLATNVEGNSELKAGERMAWLYIGRLADNTTTETITNYIRKNDIEGNIHCEELQTQGRNKAFKIGVKFEYLSTLENPEFWPEGIIVRRFRFRRQTPPRGISLEN